MILHPDRETGMSVLPIHFAAVDISHISSKIFTCWWHQRIKVKISFGHHECLYKFHNDLLIHFSLSLVADKNTGYSFWKFGLFFFYYYYFESFIIWSSCLTRTNTVFLLEDELYFPVFLNASRDKSSLFYYSFRKSSAWWGWIGQNATMRH